MICIIDPYPTPFQRGRADSIRHAEINTGAGWAGWLGWLAGLGAPPPLEVGEPMIVGRFT
ncbi:MAG: hypothetical protein V3W34_09110 [Phycisphaerae bacterium]